MGIYATYWWADGETPGPEHRAPIVYRGSHILPSDDDPRDGSVDVSGIPGHIEGPGRPAIDEELWHPWLRLSVNDETVILDRVQVAGLHAALGEWLKLCPEAVP